MPYQVRVDAEHCFRISGEQGLKGMMGGLRIMKAWADENTTGWRYIGGLKRFQFETQDDADRFAERFTAPAEQP